MAATIKLSDDLVSAAKRSAHACSRSVPKQIEYWSKIGKIAEENPDLSYNFIKGVLLGLEEFKDNNVTEYKFD